MEDLRILDPPARRVKHPLAALLPQTMRSSAPCRFLPDETHLSIGPARSCLFSRQQRAPSPNRFDFCISGVVLRSPVYLGAWRLDEGNQHSAAQKLYSKSPELRPRCLLRES